MSNLGKMLLWLLGLIILCFHPVTRKVIWFILPLGSGWDDFIVLGLVVLFIIIAIVGGANGVMVKKIKQSWKWLKE